MIKPIERYEGMRDESRDPIAEGIGKIPGMCGQRLVSPGKLAQAFSLLARNVVYPYEKHGITGASHAQDESGAGLVRLPSPPDAPPNLGIAAE